MTSQLTCRSRATPWFVINRPNSRAWRANARV